MKNIVTLILVGLIVWAPLSTLLFYAQGGDENELQKNIKKYRESINILIRGIGNIAWLFFDMTNRWVISIVSFVLLFLFKIGGY